MHPLALLNQQMLVLTVGHSVFEFRRMLAGEPVKLLSYKLITLYWCAHNTHTHTHMHTHRHTCTDTGTRVHTRNESERLTKVAFHSMLTGRLFNIYFIYVYIYHNYILIK